jgi:hypothetical protein
MCARVLKRGLSSFSGAEDRSKLRAAPKVAAGSGAASRRHGRKRPRFRHRSAGTDTRSRRAGRRADKRLGWPADQAGANSPVRHWAAHRGRRRCRPQIDQVEARLDGDVDMDIVVSDRRETEPQRIRKAVEEDMVPHTLTGTCAGVSATDASGWGRRHQSGKGTGGDILRGGQHPIDPAKSKGIERTIPAELAVVLL